MIITSRFGCSLLLERSLLKVIFDPVLNKSFFISWSKLLVTIALSTPYSLQMQHHPHCKCTTHPHSPPLQGTWYPYTNNNSLPIQSNGIIDVQVQGKSNQFSYSLHLSYALQDPSTVSVIFSLFLYHIGTLIHLINLKGFQLYLGYFFLFVCHICT